VPSQITQKSIQSRAALAGLVAKKLADLVQVSGSERSSVVEYCGG